MVCRRDSESVREQAGGSYNGSSNHLKIWVRRELVDASLFPGIDRFAASRIGHCNYFNLDIGGFGQGGNLHR